MDLPKDIIDQVISHLNFKDYNTLASVTRINKDFHRLIEKKWKKLSLEDKQLKFDMNVVVYWETRMNVPWKWILRCKTNLFDPKVVNTGTGTLIYEDGSLYEGDLVNGKKEGNGTFWCKGRDRYQGQWKNDEMNGIGAFYHYFGGRYWGEWANNKFHGSGTYYFTSGKKYNGNWNRGVKDGQGTLYHPDKNRYEGMWALDKKHGEGIWIYPDGKSEKVLFIEDVKCC